MTRNHFLDVERSLSGRAWVDRLDARERGIAEAIHSTHGHDELVARVLAGRGIDVDEAATFLEPRMRDLMVDPSTFADMDAAASRLADAVERGESVAIFGDYDVDGATSSALLARALRFYGLDPRIYIPDRIFEGYGPNPAAITELVDDGATLIVTVDCGSSSTETLALAKEKGADVVVFDHHQVGDPHLPVAAHVNPNREDDLSGQGFLSAAGVVFMGLVALNREMKRRSATRAQPDLKALLDIVALGTVCDVVPLRGVNRAFVVNGLAGMRRHANRGLAALGRVARQNGPPTPYHLGFLLGPRINAGGRIGDAALGARLLTTDDAEEAERIAIQLDGLNRERQRMEREMLRQAVEEAEAEIGLGEGPPVLVTGREDWHPGVVGLLASRLKDRFARPAFAIAFGQGGVGTASGRSVAGVDLGRLVRKAKTEGLIEKGGGHAMAAGLTVTRDKLADLRTFLEAEATKAGADPARAESLRIDGATTARGASPRFVDMVERAGPYGAGHDRPVFALPNHTVAFARAAKGTHVSFSLRSRDGATVRGIAFNAADTPMGEALLNEVGGTFHVAGTLENEFYQGRSQVKLRLRDLARPPDGGRP